MERVKVDAGGNIFEALGFEADEAANLLIRSQLMGELKQYIRDQDMSLRNAAKYFDTSHSRVSDLMQGRIDKFKIDYLVNLLAKIGKRVKIQIEDLESA